MADINEYPIRNLTFGDHRWRIDWFGAVTYEERYRRKSQPLIEVQLSQLPADLSDFKELFQPQGGQWLKTRQVKLPVGFLPRLKVGDVWQYDFFVETPHYDREHFSNLQINRHNAFLIKAGVSEDEGSTFFLPRSHHPYHMRHTQSYCMLIKHEACNIVIPAIELIRFYFGSSSQLISKIFDVPFLQENFWVSAEREENGSKAKIHLAPEISGWSASDVARIAFSKVARAAVELIGNSCLVATTNGHPAYPKATFPFEGKTDIQVSGKWLPFDGQEQGVFLVFELISCSHAFPFSGLQYTSERGGTNVKAKKPRSDKNQRRFSKELEESKVLVDEEPSSARAPRELSIFSGTKPKFPDLSRKTVSKIDVEEVPTILHTQQGALMISGSSVGHGGRDARIQEIDLVTADTVSAAVSGSKAASQVLTTAIFVQLTAKLLGSGRFSSVDIVRLDPRQRFDHLSTMPQIVDQNGEVSPSCLVATSHDDNGVQTGTRHRKISIGRALELNASRYFMVPEPLPTVQGLNPEIELHLITDRSQSITNNDELQAAMGVHFSNISEIGRPCELALGVESVIFKVADANHHDDPISHFSEKLYEDCLKHIS